MRLHEITLYKKISTSKDKLGNPIYDVLPFLKGEGRKSIWNATELAFDSRIISKKLIKIITTISKKSLSEASRLEIYDSSYSIEEIKGEDDDRWRVVYLKSYGA